MSTIHQKYAFSALDAAFGVWTGDDFASAALPLGTTETKAPTLITLANMASGDEETQPSSLIADAAGDLFGTTPIAGANDDDDGTVFEVAKTKSGYASAPATRLDFAGFGGAKPGGSLITDAAGDLFGTTTAGGFFNRGVVFELAKTDNGYAKAPTVLAVFSGPNGQNPIGSLVTDAAGDLFGVTTYGGASGDGTVFEIVKNAGGFDGTPVTLANFTGADGANPYAGLVADAAGDLFGTTSDGGADNDGTVFEIAKTKGGYAAAPTTLVSFSGADGEFPVAAGNLVMDSAGNLFGMTSNGGANGYETVFEIAKTNGGYADAPTVLVSFGFQDGASPNGSLLLDAAGNLFGAAEFGGANGEGAVFEIAKTKSGYAKTPTLLVNFNGTNGANPVGSLIADASGNLFGATYAGGAESSGTVFEITDSGYEPPAAPATINQTVVTKTIVQSTGPKVPSFVSAMAGLGASAASHLHAGEVWSARELMLTSPRSAIA
jgi:uncharacterized repeat protein (TIGR03803 family)